MKGPERAKRDAKVLQLFVAGATYRQIAEAVDLASVASVDSIIKREMAKAARRRDRLVDQAFDVYVERTEALFKAHFPKALAGDHRSAEVCRRILAQQARLYGLDIPAGGPGNAEPPEPPLEGDTDDTDDAEGAPVSDLAAWRSRQNA